MGKVRACRGEEDAEEGRAAQLKKLKARIVQKEEKLRGTRLKQWANKMRGDFGAACKLVRNEQMEAPRQVKNEFDGAQSDGSRQGALRIIRGFWRRVWWRSDGYVAGAIEQATEALGEKAAVETWPGLVGGNLAAAAAAQKGGPAAPTDGLGAKCLNCRKNFGTR